MLIARKIIQTLGNHLAEYAEMSQTRYGILCQVVTISYLWDEDEHRLERDPEKIDLGKFRVGI